MVCGEARGSVGGHQVCPPENETARRMRVNVATENHQKYCEKVQRNHSPARPARDGVSEGSHNSTPSVDRRSATTPEPLGSQTEPQTAQAVKPRDARSYKDSFDSYETLAHDRSVPALDGVWVYVTPAHQASSGEQIDPHVDHQGRGTSAVDMAAGAKETAMECSHFSTNYIKGKEGLQEVKGTSEKAMEKAKGTSHENGTNHSEYKAYGSMPDDYCGPDGEKEESLPDYVTGRDTKFRASPEWAAHVARGDGGDAKAEDRAHKEWTDRVLNGISEALGEEYERMKKSKGSNELPRNINQKQHVETVRALPERPGTYEAGSSKNPTDGFNTAQRFIARSNAASAEAVKRGTRNTTPPTTTSHGGLAPHLACDSAPRGRAAAGDESPDGSCHRSVTAITRREPDLERTPPGGQDYQSGRASAGRAPRDKVAGNRLQLLRL